MAKLCYGEFDFPEGRPEDRLAGRTARTVFLQNEFLKAIAKHAPKVWEELYSLRELFSPLITAKLAWPVITGRQPLRVRRKVVMRFDPQDGRDPLTQLAKPETYMAEAVKRLEDWACRWNLNEEWILQRAYDALRIWRRYDKPNAAPWRSATWGGAVSGELNPPAPPTGMSEYAPLFTSRTDYLQEVRSNGSHGDLKRAKAYCEDVEQCYETAGFVRCKADEKRNLDQHLEWAVRFQVCGEGLDDIANAAGDPMAGGIEKSTVLRAVYDLLHLIHLNKRVDAKPGRRRGSKNKQSRIVRELGR